MIILTIVHGDIEDAEEQDSINAISKAITDSGTWRGTSGTNDTTTWSMDVFAMPEEVALLVGAAALVYEHWRVIVASTSGRGLG